MSVLSEIAHLRRTFVDLYVWEREAQEKWRATYPDLTAMLPSHLPPEASNS